MNSETIAKLLRDVAQIIDAGHWTQGQAARNADYERVQIDAPDAVKFCALGALGRVSIDYRKGRPMPWPFDPMLHSVVSLLTDEADEMNFEQQRDRLMRWNDDRFRKPEEVHDLFVRAAERLEQM